MASFLDSLVGGISNFFSGNDNPGSTTSTLGEFNALTRGGVPTDTGNSGFSLAGLSNLFGGSGANGSSGGLSGLAGLAGLGLDYYQNKQTQDAAEAAQASSQLAADRQYALSQAQYDLAANERARQLAQQEAAQTAFDAGFETSGLAAYDPNKKRVFTDAAVTQAV